MHASFRTLFLMSALFVAPAFLAGQDYAPTYDLGGSNLSSANSGSSYSGGSDYRPTYDYTPTYDYAPPPPVERPMTPPSAPSARLAKVSPRAVNRNELDYETRIHHRWVAWNFRRPNSRSVYCSRSGGMNYSCGCGGAMAVTPMPVSCGCGTTGPSIAPSNPTVAPPSPPVEPTPVADCGCGS